MIPRQVLRVLVILAEKLDASNTNWAVDGGTNLALQGIDIVPNDIDVLTDEAGAYGIARLFSDRVVSPASFKTSRKYDSHFGRLEVEGISIEVMGDLRVFRRGRWLSIMTPETRKLVECLRGRSQSARGIYRIPEGIRLSRRKTTEDKNPLDFCGSGR